MKLTKNMTELQTEQHGGDEPGKQKSYQKEWADQIAQPDKTATI